jgi:hypothetical protein
MQPRFAFTPLPVSRSDSPRRPEVVSGLAGTWRGHFTADDGSTEPFKLLRDGSVDSAVTGRFLFFSKADVAPTGVKLLEAAQRSFVALIGPYFDPREDADVVTVLEGTRNGDAIEGHFYTRVPDWKETVRQGSFTAIRADTTHRAA